MMLFNSKLFNLSGTWLEALQAKESKKAEDVTYTEDIVFNQEHLFSPFQEEIIFEKEDLASGDDETKHLREIHTELKHIPFNALAF